jgi:hypothetical protein
MQSRTLCLADCAGADEAGTCVPNGFGCCRTNSNCPLGQRCIDGMCKAPPGMNRCWTDRECSFGSKCIGAQICPCGTACALPDVPGTCS